MCGIQKELVLRAPSRRGLPGRRGRAMGGWPGTQRELGGGVARRRQAKLEGASGEQEGTVSPVEGHREAGTMEGGTGFGGLAVTGGRGVLS